MNLDTRLPVVLLWHMHQPNYRDAQSGEYLLPWTYLHAIKDYVDMAGHLEANPAARAVVNFTPVLIEQLQELAASTAAHLQHGSHLPDAVLRVLAALPLPQAAEPRLALLNACLRAHKVNLIERFPPYQALAELAPGFASTENVGYASDQYLRDLGVWFHIAWLGETVKRGDLRVAALIAHERNYTAQHCRSLLELISELLNGVLPRYRALAERGQVELSVTPYAHPLMPLLIDFRSARESQPEVSLPQAERYPGGAERVAWHLDEAQRVFAATFGFAPRGCWPSEGAISAPVLNLLNERGYQWAASGGNVLQGCLQAAANVAGASASAGADAGTGTTTTTTTTAATAAAANIYQRPSQSLRCVFRDDALSDLVGFSYSTWHGDDAVSHFIAELEVAAAAKPAPTQLLIALDGENAWEHYPFNAYYFLQGLYAALSNHAQLRLSTLGEVLARHPASVALPAVRAGSWVHGTLATWMGDQGKNRAWDLLVEAKLAVDRVLGAGRVDDHARARIERQLAQCESSDWFWWFGDYNPPDSVSDFDRLYRHQLRSLYELLQLPVPTALDRPISSGGAGARETGGVMRRANE
jgi:alpha-amylase/alpha-mannosidase (GH57 family)